MSTRIESSIALPVVPGASRSEATDSYAPSETAVGLAPSDVRVASGATAPDAVGVATAQVGGGIGYRDPVALLLSAQRELQREQQQVQQGAVTERLHQAEEARIARDEALEAARKAARKSGLLGKLGKILKVIATVAAAAASSVTGGASAALVVAGSALTLAGPKLAHQMHQMGLIDAEAAKWLGVGLQIAGSGMLATGGVAAAAGTAGRGGNAVVVAEKAIRGVGSTAEVGRGVTEGAESYFGYRHEAQMAGARRHGVKQRSATDAMQHRVDELSDTMERFMRIAHHLHEASEAEGRGREAALQVIG